jgi:hypothetical protein
MKRDKILEAYEKSILKEETTFAEKAYKDKEREIDTLIKKISKKLDKHSKDFKKNGSTDWGFVGDLGKIAQDLREMDEYFMVK